MDTTFKKHDYYKPDKKRPKLLSEYDPRPTEFRGTAKDRLPALLESIRGQQLCISLMLDEKCCAKESDVLESPECHLPSNEDLKQSVELFKKSLAVSEDKIHEIELNTREQRLTPLWFSVRRYRLTASNFGRIFSRKATTPPDKLVLNLIQRKSFVTPAITHGIENEDTAVSEYVQYQHANGHPDLAYSQCGFHISETHPFLGASPDGAVYDPSETDQPFGFLEVKCPYTSRDILPREACKKTGFFCSYNTTTCSITLKRQHAYYAQVQGQMAIGQRKWCDFVVYTYKGIHVERIWFNEAYWTGQLLPKLESFYNNCFAPELVSPVHALGLPIRDLSKVDDT